MDMAINKVIYGTTVLVDLTEDTVTAATLAEGVTAHGADGEAITGTMSGGPTYTRLWTNPSPASAFAAQIVSLSESLKNYDAVRIVWDRWYNGGVTEDNYLTNSNAIIYVYDLTHKANIINDQQRPQIGAVSYETSYVYARRAWFQGSVWDETEWTLDYSKIQFGNGMRGNASGTSSNAIIPVFIDGVKF